MTQRRPKLSVVAYVYNYADFLPDMIRSVLSQTYGDFELFILDDGSDDGTLRAIRSLADDRRLRFATQQHRGRDRLHETFNRCLAQTDGELVAIANGDDVMAPEKLALQVAALECRPELDVVFHDAEFVDGGGRQLEGSFAPPAEVARDLEGRLGPHMFRRNFVPNPTVLFRRSVADAVGPQEYGWVHDYQFWLKAAVAGMRFGFLPERLIRYRVHERSHSTSSERARRLAEEDRRMRVEMRARYAIEELYPEIERCRVAAEACYDAHLELGNHFAAGPLPLFRAAAREYGEALRFAPGGLAARHNLALACWLAGEAGAEKELEALASVCSLAGHNLDALRGDARGAVFAIRTPDESELLRLRSSPPAPHPCAFGLPRGLWRELLR